MSIKELSCFISYSHKDMKMKQKFVNHFAPLRKKYKINLWHDSCLTAGQPVDQAVMSHLNRSDIVFLLISADYIASNFCYEVELKKAIERHNNNQCIVVPVVLRPVGGSLRDLSFGHLLMVPNDGKPITKFNPRDDGYVDAITKIDELLSKWFSENADENKVTSSTSVLDLPHIQAETYHDEVFELPEIGLKIFQDGELKPYPVTQSIIDNYPILCERLSNFTAKVQQFNQSQIEKFSTAKNRNINWWNRRINGYLFDFLSYIMRELLGNMHGVRIHLRKLVGSEYEGIVAVAEEGNSIMNVKKPTTMPAANSMIAAANHFDAPLIKSFNEAYHCRGTNDKWIDYLTCVFKKLDSGLQPVLTLGISIDASDYEIKRDWLILFAHTRIDNIIQGLMLNFFSKCKQLDNNFDLKMILSAQVKKGGHKHE